MYIYRRAIIILSIALSACGGQNPPVISTIEEDTNNGVLSATPSSEPFPTLLATQRPPNTASATHSATEQRQTATPISTLDIFSLTGAPTDISTLTGTEFVPTSIIPQTGQEPILSKTAVPDKFQEFEIPVTGDEGIPFGLLPVTGFPRGTITKIDIPSLYNLISPRLVIPSLDINIPIFEIEVRNGTWDVSWLWDQAGWLEGTAYPTGNGNSILTGHVVTADGKNGPFAHLKYLTSNDYVFLANSGLRYIYKVDTIDYVKPNDMSVLTQETDSWITLITCDSYDETKGEYLLRVVVRAKLVEVQKIE